MVAEDRAREPRTMPIEIAYSSDATVPRLGGFSRHGLLTQSADGAVHFALNRATTSPGPQLWITFFAFQILFCAFAAFFGESADGDCLRLTGSQFE